MIDVLNNAIDATTDDGFDFAFTVVKVMVIVLLAAYGARFVRRHIYANLGRTAVDRNIASLAANLAMVGIYILGTTLVLGVLGASWSAMLTVIGASTVAISLALQDMLRSYVAGVYLLLERPFAVGDRIQVRDVEGTVESVELRTTLLRTRRGDEVTVPNATVFAEIVTNRSARRDDRVTVVIGNLTEPLDQLPGLVSQTLSGIEGISQRPPVIEVRSSTEAGTVISATVFHPPGTEPSSRLMSRLRASFPAAELTVEQD